MYDYPLHSWGVCSKCCGQSSSAVKRIIKVTHILLNNDKADKFSSTCVFLSVYSTNQFYVILKNKSSFRAFHRETCWPTKIIPSFIASFFHYWPVLRYFETQFSSAARSKVPQTLQMLNSEKKDGNYLRYQIRRLGFLALINRTGGGESWPNAVRSVHTTEVMQVSPIQTD